jgi:hypothetical protein
MNALSVWGGKIGVAVATPAGDGGFDDQRAYQYTSHQDIFDADGTYLAPDHPLPLPSS